MIVGLLALVAKVECVATRRVEKRDRMGEGGAWVVMSFALAEKQAGEEDE